MRLFGSAGVTPEAAPDTKALRRARVEQARRAGWEELDAADLIPRGPARLGWLIDSDTDAVYVSFRGATFEPHTARLVADRQPGLSFYVDEDGWPTVLERLPQTWSELYGRRARREARR